MKTSRCPIRFLACRSLCHWHISRSLNTSTLALYPGRRVAPTDPDGEPGREDREEGLERPPAVHAGVRGRVRNGATQESDPGLGAGHQEPAGGGAAGG